VYPHGREGEDEGVPGNFFFVIPAFAGIHRQSLHCHIEPMKLQEAIHSFISILADG
jgi:hypothetical protein